MCLVIIGVRFRQECLTRSKYEPGHLLKGEAEKRAFENQIREARMKILKSAVKQAGLTNTEQLVEYLNSDQYVVCQLYDILRTLYDMALADYTD
jgi:transcription initiation factor TFIIIB Brf1 subunit/transcription initiation factor TFIIB